MAVYPAGVGRISAVDKGYVQVLGSGGQNDIKQVWLCLLGRLGQQVYRLSAFQKEDFVPETGQKRRKFFFRHLAGFLIIIDIQEGEKSVSGSDGQIGSAPGQESFREPVVEGGEVYPVLVAPGFLRSFSQGGLKGGKAAFFCKIDVINFGQLIKGEKFVINLIFPAFRPAGNQPDHRSGYAVGLENFSTLTLLFPSCT